VIYTIQASVDVTADSEHEAYETLKHAIAKAKKAEIVYLDAEVTDVRDDQIEDENPRERGDDDGVEYADPRDEMEDRLLRD
jgi:hypothetical protein